MIADAIAHAIDPPLLLLLLLEEQEVILVEIQGYLADLVVQDKLHEFGQQVHEASDKK